MAGTASSAAMRAAEAVRRCRVILSVPILRRLLRMRNRFLALAVTVVVAGLCSVTTASAQTAAPTRRPDVIFVPTPEAVVEAMLQVANVQKGDVVYDLGCGDGRIPVTAARKYGARGFCYDIDPQRIKEAQEN